MDSYYKAGIVDPEKSVGGVNTEDMGHSAVVTGLPPFSRTNKPRTCFSYRRAGPFARGFTRAGHEISFLLDHRRVRGC